LRRLRAADRYGSSNNASSAGWTVGEGVGDGVGEGTSGAAVQVAVRAKTTTRASHVIGDNPKGSLPRVVIPNYANWRKNTITA